jgi:hypothetical protein
VSATSELLTELLDEIERVGVPRKQVPVWTALDTFLVEHTDTGDMLTFSLDAASFGLGRLRPWTWNVWRGIGTGTSAYPQELARGREKDIEGMVGKVLEFLGEEG